MATRFGEGRFLVEKWLEPWLWASSDELFKVTGFTVQNINYHLRNMRENETADYRMVGRGREALRRWIFYLRKATWTPAGRPRPRRNGPWGRRPPPPPAVGNDGPHSRMVVAKRVRTPENLQYAGPQRRLPRCGPPPFS